MRVPGRFYASEGMLEKIESDQALEQVKNVACLPGIVWRSLAMPDIHWGYGFPIGGVAATSMQEGVISPGGVGYDINCGVRLLKTALDAVEVKDRIVRLVDFLFDRVPSGVGSKGDLRLDQGTLRRVLEEGLEWAVKEGYAWPEDPIWTEENGRMEGADAHSVSQRALERGLEQLGTLGSGNHFLELQEVAEVYDDTASKRLGIHLGQLVIMIHSGSRGLGYQVCEDAIKKMRSMPIVESLPDRQLCCASHDSQEGQMYWRTMACAANYGWVNRQMLMFRVREAFERFFGESAQALGLNLLYDVAHNIAKRERHALEGRPHWLCVHRKGATRAFGPGNEELPAQIRDLGQPVLIPGSMGTASYLLLGTQKAMEESWGSTAHGAGRQLSRKAALKATKGRAIQGEMKRLGIFVRAEGKRTLGEESPQAYKDVKQVVDVLEHSGLSRKRKF